MSRSLVRLSGAALTAVGLFVAAGGCHPISLFSLLTGDGLTTPAAWEFAPVKGKKGPILVAIVASHEVGFHQELAGLAGMLETELWSRLAEGFRHDKSRLQFLRHDKVAKWKDTHENWRSLRPQEMAESLGVDYVIYVSLENVTLYEEGSRRTLYRGKADVNVVMAKAGGEDSNDFDGVPLETSFNFQFPKGGVPRVVDNDNPLSRFRKEFVRALAVQISWQWLPRDRGDEFNRDRL